ncbi:MAG: hypothetical protein FWD12_15225 [Alphaproteobacteria bacterium]|nr:hypothetical protein [Alphaproteobacteria bacterium]
MCAPSSSSFRAAPAYMETDVLTIISDSRCTDTRHLAVLPDSVLAMIVALVVQVGTGLCSNTDEDFMIDGPLAKYVGKAASDRLSAIHIFNFNLILGLIVLHVVVIGAYAAFKGQNLVRPMITGKKRLPGAMRAPRMASPLRALLVLAFAVVVAVAVANLP